MKSTGITRKVDELGRIVLPSELRRTLDINPRDTLEIFVDGEGIILRKYQPQCIFCSDSEGIRIFKGKNICEKCLRSAVAGISGIKESPMERNDIGRDIMRGSIIEQNFEKRM